MKLLTISSLLFVEEGSILICKYFAILCFKVVWGLKRNLSKSKLAPVGVFEDVELATLLFSKVGNSTYDLSCHANGLSS